MSETLFQFSRESLTRLSVLCQQHASLSFDALQLGKVAINALARVKVHQMSGVPAIWSDTPAQGHRLGQTAPKVLQHLGEALLLHTNAVGEIDWPKHWEHRGMKPPIPPSLIIPEDSGVSIRAVSGAVGALRVGAALHLTLRSINALTDAGLGDVSALIDAAKWGLGQLKGIGLKSRQEVDTALHALLASLDDSGNIDGRLYAEIRGFPILPSEFSEGQSGRWIQILPAVISQALVARFEGPIDSDIFALRYGLAGRPKLTLQEIADARGITRQRVEQKQAYAVKIISRAMLHDDYSECPFRFHHEFSSLLRVLHRRLREVPRRLRLESELVSLASDTLGVAHDQITPVIELLTDLLQLETRGPETNRLQKIVGARGDDLLKEAPKLVDRIDRLLSAEPEGLHAYQIAAEINRRGPFELKPENVAEWVRLCPTAEGSKDGRFRCQFSLLRSLADKAFLVLTEAGKPMHFKQIAEEISRRQSQRGGEATEMAIKAQLVGDKKRFQAVGRSGEWKLATWDHIDERTILEIAIEALRKANRPLHSSEIFDYISRRRPGVARPSISALLAADPAQRCVRTAPDVWGIKVWDAAKLSSNRLAPTSATVDEV